MNGLDRQRLLLISVVAGVLAVALVAGAPVLVPSLFGIDAGDPDAYNGTTASIVDAESGETLGNLELVLADEHRERVVGLSETDSLPADRGMLFVYDTVDERPFVMRDMSFGLDIVFIDEDGRITSIHDAPEPPDGSDGTDQRYEGTGQYVLEVNRGWTAERGIEVGDTVEINWAS